MFSLGIVVFELWHPFSTGMERTVLLQDLRENNALPAAWEAANPTIARLIRCGGPGALSPPPRCSSPRARTCEAGSSLAFRRHVPVTAARACSVAACQCQCCGGRDN